MIKLAQRSIAINTSAENLFKFVSNMENYKTWFPGVIDIRSFNDLAHGTKGKQYKEVLLMPDGESELIISVVNSTQNQFFQTHGDLAEILPQMTIELKESAEKVCDINLQYHSRNSALNKNSDLISILQNDLTARSHTALTTLKRIMEDNKKA